MSELLGRRLVRPHDRITGRIIGLLQDKYLILFKDGKEWKLTFEQIVNMHELVQLYVHRPGFSCVCVCSPALLPRPPRRLPAQL